MNIAGFFRKPDLGLLIIRLVLGIIFAKYGFSKFMDGTPALEKIGGALQVFGITAFPVFWGGLAALVEMLGGCLIFLGYKFRFAAFALFLVMAVAFYYLFASSSPFSSYAHALELTAVFLGLVFIGPGKYSIDKD